MATKRQRIGYSTPNAISSTNSTTKRQRVGYGSYTEEEAKKVILDSQKPLFELANELGISPIPKHEPGNPLKPITYGIPNTTSQFYDEILSPEKQTAYLLQEIDKKLKESETFRQEISNFDTEAAKGEIKSLEAQLKEVDSYFNEILRLDGRIKYYESVIDTVPKAYRPKYQLIINEDKKKLRELEAKYSLEARNGLKDNIAQKKAEVAQKKRLQELLKNNETATTDPNFEKYIKSGTMTKEEFKALILDAPVGNDELNAAKEALYIHQNNMDTNYYLTGKSMNFEQMTNEEFDLLAYYIGKDKETGGNQAETYVELMKETLQTRRGQEIYEKYLKDNTVLQILYGVPAGLDQFANGVTSLFNFTDDYIPASPVQVAGQLAREDLADAGAKVPEWLGGASLGQMAYDTVQTTANMVPSIAASTLIGLINPVAGTAVGAGLMGASAAGNAYQEALNNGWGKAEARTYSTLIGASEALLSATVSKVFGGKLVSEAVEKAIKGVTNGFARFALNYGAAFVSEGLEEAAQEVLSPLFENIAFGYNRKGFEDIDWSEVAYSFLLGGLSGGMFETAGSGVKRISSIASVMKEYNTPQKTQKLLKLALSFPTESNANKLATKYNAQVKADGKISANKVYNLVVATENVITERLTNLGEKNNVSAVASAALKALTTGQLTAKEKAVLQSSKHGAELLAEINITEEAETPVLQSSANEGDVQNSALQSNAEGDIINNGQQTVTGDDINGSTNPGLLGGRTVSTANRGGNSLRQQGENSRKISSFMGVTSDGKGNPNPVYRAGDSGWFVRQAEQKGEVRNRFEESVRGKISRIAPSGFDTIGRKISNEIKEKFKNTVFKDENGNLLSLYHWTQAVFEIFEKGEFGFHFGTLDAARDRHTQSLEEDANTQKGFYKEVYLNITNPYYIPFDAGTWRAQAIAYQLKKDGIITDEQYETFRQMEGFDDNTYDNPAAQAVREFLSENGYDGIIYENDSEDAGGISVIAFYPDQILTVAENGVLKENNGVSEADLDNGPASFMPENQSQNGSITTKLQSDAKKGTRKRSPEEQMETHKKSIQGARNRISLLSPERQKYLSEQHSKYRGILNQLEVGDVLISDEGEIIGEVVSNYEGNLFIVGDFIVETILNDSFTDDTVITFLETGNGHFEKSDGTRITPQDFTADNDIGESYFNNDPKRHHLTKSEQDYIKFICKALGIKVKFIHITSKLLKEYGYDIPQNKLPDGFYNKEDKTIYIGFTGVNPVKFVFKHELTHFGEGTKLYKKFVNAVRNSKAYRNWYIEKAKQLVIDGEIKIDINSSTDTQIEAAVREGYISTYERSKPDFDVEDATCEMVADFVGDCLFGNNPSALERMVSGLNYEQCETVWQHIKEYFAYLKRKLSGEENLVWEITRLENQFNHMLSEAVQTKKATTEGDGVQFSFGVTQREIDKYVDAAYKNENDEDYKPYSEPSERLLNDVSNEIDISEYSHALRDNDIRHIRNSHGELTNEKYPVTSSDIKKIPWIVENYDKVFVKTNSRGKPGIVYVKVTDENVVYYLEAVTEEYHNEKLLVNKQMVKTGIDEIPNLYGLREAINKKESSSQYLADLKEIRKAYVQDVKENYSNDIVPYDEDSVKNNISEGGANNSKNGTNNSENKLEFTFSRALDKEKIAEAERLEKELEGAYDGNEMFQKMEIWGKTGLTRDPSGVWVYEIDDSKMRFFALGDRFKKRKTPHGRNLLKNYIRHKELFERYPQLEKTELAVYDSGVPGEKGGFSREDNCIVLDKTFLETATRKEVVEVIVHEIQHAAQYFDERENGASIEYWNQRLKLGTMPKNPKTGREYTPYEAYRATRGEFEARMSQKRLFGMEPEVKVMRLGMPFYDPENTISADLDLVSVKEQENAENRPSLKFSIPTDREYTKAVESGDTQALQQMVDNKAKASGYTERLYHQTGAEFTEFNTDNQKAGKYDWELPTGMFLKPSDNDIGLKGKKQMDLYAKQQNPLEFKDRAEAQQYWRDNVEGYADAADKIIGIDTEYQNKLEVAAQNTRNYLKKWRKNNPGVDSREIYSDAEYQRLNDLEDSIVDEWEAKSDEASLEAKQLIDNYIAESDYDGIVLLNDIGAMGRATKTYIVFDSAQLKDASPITYDDSGNVIPLSDRFDGDKKDIRFSMPSILQQARENLDKYERGEMTREEYLEATDELWGKANETHGILPEGENANAPIATPKAIAEDKPTERFTRTIIETGKLTDEMLQGIEEKVLLGDFSYKVISDEAATKKAQAAINDGTAEDIWTDAVNDGKRFDKNQLAIGEQLLADAIKDGDTKRVLELSAELADAFTRAGQIVQAARLLKKMTGAGRLVSAQRMVKTLNKDIREKHGDKAKTIEIDAVLAEQLFKAKTAAGVEMVYNDILKNVAEQMPVTFLDKWNAWRYFAMLSNPKTHIRNVVGNAIFVPAVRIKNIIALGIEQSAVKVGALKLSDVTKSLVVKKEYIDFAQNDSKNEEVKQLLKGNKYNDKTVLKENQRIFKNNALEFLTKFNSNALEAEDMLFKNKHYINALAGYLQAKGINLKTVTEDVLTQARIYAVNEARKATFNDESALANWIQNFGNKNFATNLAVEGVLPFKRTPINIVKRGIEYSPIGLTKTLTKGVFDVKKGKITPTEFIDGLASGLTGTGIMLVGMFLASLGCITGGEDDDELSEFEKLLGKQEYAVQILGKSYTIDWAAPSVIPFFIGAEIVNTVSAGEDFSISKIGNAVWNSLEPITNLSMLSGMQGVIESARYAEPSQILASIAGDAITSYAMQAIPSLSGAVSRTIDPTQRSWYVDKNNKTFDAFSQTVANNVASKIPGLSYAQIPKIDAWGREVSRGNVGERVVENFISPGYYSSIEYDQVSEELKRIFVKTGANVFPKTAAKSFQVNNETKHLTADEYVTYAKAKGEFAFNYIYEFINGSAYKGLDDAERTDVIENLYKLANAKAKAEVSDYDLTKQFKTVTNRERNGGSAVDYYIYLAIKK